MEIHRVSESPLGAPGAARGRGPATPRRSEEIRGDDIDRQGGPRLPCSSFFGGLDALPPAANGRASGVAFARRDPGHDERSHTRPSDAAGRGDRPGRGGRSRRRPGGAALRHRPRRPRDPRRSDERARLVQDGAPPSGAPAPRSTRRPGSATSSRARGGERGAVPDGGAPRGVPGDRLGHPLARGAAADRVPRTRGHVLASRRARDLRRRGRAPARAVHPAGVRGRGAGCCGSRRRSGREHDRGHRHADPRHVRRVRAPDLRRGGAPDPLCLPRQSGRLEDVGGCLPTPAPRPVPRVARPNPPAPPCSMSRARGRGRARGGEATSPRSGSRLRRTPRFELAASGIQTARHSTLSS